MLRESVPFLVGMATGKTPKTSEIFSGYGETQGNQLEATTASILKQHEDDAKASRALSCSKN